MKLGRGGDKGIKMLQYYSCGFKEREPLICEVKTFSYRCHGHGTYSNPPPHPTLGTASYLLYFKHNLGEHTKSSEVLGGYLAYHLRTVNGWNQGRETKVKEGKLYHFFLVLSLFL